MKTLSFELTMPNVGSWNGKWTGAERKYYIIKRVDETMAKKIMQDAESHPIYEGLFYPKQVGVSSPSVSHYYNFGDGWGANVKIETIDAREANKRRKASCGFYGYDWMVDSIMMYGEILNSKQIRERSVELV